MRAGTASERLSRVTASSPDERGGHAAADVGGRAPVTAASGGWLGWRSCCARGDSGAAGRRRQSVGVLSAGVVGLAAASGRWLVVPEQPGCRALAGCAVAVAAPVIVVALYIAPAWCLGVLVVVVLIALAGAAARAALAPRPSRLGMPERATPPPQRPFVIMNPRSGGGKVAKFDLQTKATALGAQVALIDGPGPVDVAAMARGAVADGADLLGVAGGDGTQALVAGIAAEHDLPFLVISAGTRNHFAMDLGLDREHPDTGLDAFTDGVELTMDLGVIGGRTFVNNASFGAYAEIVQSPAYRDDKRGTTLKMLPDLLSGQRGPRLTARIDGDVTIEGPPRILISNNPYELGDPAGLGRRDRLDTGVLGVVAVTVDSAAQAAGLLRGRRSTGLRTLHRPRGRHRRRRRRDPGRHRRGIGHDAHARALPDPARRAARPRSARAAGHARADSQIDPHPAAAPGTEPAPRRRTVDGQRSRQCDRACAW